MAGVRGKGKAGFGLARRRAPLGHVLGQKEVRNNSCEKIDSSDVFNTLSHKREFVMPVDEAVYCTGAMLRSRGRGCRAEEHVSRIPAAEGKFFQCWWDLGWVEADLKVIWEMSHKDCQIAYHIADSV